MIIDCLQKNIDVIFLIFIYCIPVDVSTVEKV